MIKLLQCVRKQPELSDLDFRQRWREYGEELAKLADEMNAVRVVLDTTFVIDLNRQLRDVRGSLPAFDGVAEIYWESGPELLRATEKDEMQERIDRLRDFQESFMKVAESSIFLVSEAVISG